MKTVQIFPSSKDMAKKIARSWCERAQRAAENHRVFSVVVSGGSTGPALYREMATPEWRGRIPWEWVHIFWADERCVPPDHEESNYRAVSSFLLKHIAIPEENVHRIRGEEDPAEESERYAKEIQRHQELRQEDASLFDWVCLGVGRDGHTASLFPGGDLFQSRNICEAVQHPQTGQSRITLTPMAIERSNRITYHVIGREKARIVSKLASVSSPGGEDYPTAQIPGEWFLDREAASNLRLGEKL